LKTLLRINIICFFGINLILIFLSCSAPVSIFRTKCHHEQYGEKIINAGLKETALGSEWFSASEKVFSTPQKISLPYKEVGYFAAEKPRAAGLFFSAKQGEKVYFKFEKNPSAGFVIYIDLWEIDAKNNKHALITSIDPTIMNFNYEIKKSGTYLLRLQPELLKSGEYSIKYSCRPVISVSCFRK
jgi:predicted secreted protein